MRTMGIGVYQPKTHFYQAPREFDEQDEAGSEAPSESQRDSSFMEQKMLRSGSVPMGEVVMQEAGNEEIVEEKVFKEEDL